MLPLAICASLVGPSGPTFAEPTFELVKSFEDGRGPSAVTLGSDGALYAAKCAPAVLEIDAAGSFTPHFAPAPSSVCSLVVGSDGVLYGYGRTSGDDPNTPGTVFRIDGAGAVIPLHAFSDEEGHPESSEVPGGYGQLWTISLLRGSGSALYGVTRHGGSAGTIFRLDAGTFSSVHAFSDEEGTPSRLLRAGDGVLYGTTAGNGSSVFGTVFRIDGAGTFSTLHTFQRDDFELCDNLPNPSSNDLVVGSDGTLYGVHTHGSDSFAGKGGPFCYASRTAFRIDGAGSFSALHSFSDSERPITPVVAGSDGGIYGITDSGSSNSGTVFRIDGAGAFASLHSFSYEEGYPGALFPGSDGGIYGTTRYGGSAGTIYRVDAGNFGVVHSFSDEEGAPDAYSLVPGNDGALYGMTEPGSAHRGTVFRIGGGGSFASLHSFSDEEGDPGALFPGRDGALYGNTSGGSASPIFRIDAGTFSTVHSFSGRAVPIVLGDDGAIYGIAYAASTTLFKIDGAGLLTSLHEFGDVEGTDPIAPMILGSDGALYGTTRVTSFRIGGTGSFRSLARSGSYGEPLVQGSDSAFYGIHSGGSAVFKVDSAGASRILHSFFPDHLTGPLVLGRDGWLYGAIGSVSSNGMVFRIDSSGRLESVYEFRGVSDGATPASPLALGSDGALYGTTDAGGLYGSGTVFRIDGAGAFSALHSFNGTDGSGAYARLVLGSDGALYGTTSAFTASNFGTVFRIDRAGTFTSLHSFSGSDGAGPGALVLGSDGALYGTTTELNGTVFRIDGAGAFQSLHRFSGPDGAYPIGPLVLGSEGALYGATGGGGASDLGTVFRIDSAGSFTSLHSFSGTDGERPSAALALGIDGALYGPAREGGPLGGGVVYRIFEPGSLRQVVFFDPPPDRRLGDPPFTARATASSGLPVSLRASGSCSVAGDQVTLTGFGLCTLTASQVGDVDFQPAPEVSQAFHVRLGGGKALVCHKGKRTKLIRDTALAAHLGHGDPEGFCPEEGAALVCHKGKTTKLARGKSLAAHLRHGDVHGACPEGA